MVLEYTTPTSKLDARQCFCAAGGTGHAKRLPPRPHAEYDVPSYAALYRAKGRSAGMVPDRLLFWS